MKNKDKEYIKLTRVFLEDQEMGDPGHLPPEYKNCNNNLLAKIQRIESAKKRTPSKEAQESLKRICASVELSAPE